MDKNNTDKVIFLLHQEFKRIKGLGYLPTTKRGAEGAKDTFLKKLQERDPNLTLNYYGLPLYVRRSYSKNSLTLFNLLPKGSDIDLLKETYGSNLLKTSLSKILATKIQVPLKTKVNNAYYFKLALSPLEEKVYLEIFDQCNNLLSLNYYWTYQSLREVITSNLNTIALVKTWTKKTLNLEYFFYYKLNIYVFKGFSSFLTSLQEGKIEVNIQLNSVSNTMKFEISEEYLLSIFNLYR